MKKINKLCLKNCFLEITILFAALFYSFHSIKITNCYFLYQTIFYKNIVLCIIIPLWFWLVSNIDELYYNFLLYI